MVKWISMVSLIAGMAAAPGYAGATALPDTLAVGEETLYLNGAGVYEATVFNVDVFEAGLYVERTTRDGEALLDSEQTRGLVLRFERAVERDEFLEVAASALPDASGADGAQRDRFLSALPDADEGDVFAFTYHPRGALSLSKNGRAIVSVTDSALARKLFASFIGPGAVTPDLKGALLGRG